MKKLFVMALAVLLFASCKSLPERFDSFVTNVETNYESYSDADWAAKDQKFASFKNEYAKCYDELSAGENAVMLKCIARYEAVVAKTKIKSAASGVKRFLEGAGEYVEGLVEGVTQGSTN